MNKPIRVTCQTNIGDKRCYMPGILIFESHKDYAVLRALEENPYKRDEDNTILIKYLKEE